MLVLGFTKHCKGLAVDGDQERIQWDETAYCKRCSANISKLQASRAVRCSGISVAVGMCSRIGSQPSRHGVLFRDVRTLRVLRVSSLGIRCVWDLLSRSHKRVQPLSICKLLDAGSRRRCRRIMLRQSWLSVVRLRGLRMGRRDSIIL